MFDGNRNTDSIRRYDNFYGDINQSNYSDKRRKKKKDGSVIR